MNRSDEPLAWRLREAAIDRADARTERVDEIVLEPDGVIDLRELDRERRGASIAAPAAALATIRGRLGDAAEVSELYADPEPERSRWRLGTRSRHQETDDPMLPSTHAAPETNPAASRVSPPISRLEMVPLARDETTPAATLDDSGPRASAPERPPSEPEPDTAAERHSPVGETSDQSRPTADCPRCAGLGRRDLFDRFSQVEYYSCDDCNHMWQQDRR